MNRRRMEIMKKSICLFLILVVIVTVITGCASGGQSSTDASLDSAASGAVPSDSSAGGTTISVWTGYPDNQAWLDWVTEKYMEENPGYNVEVTTFPISDFETKVAAAIPAGSCADVISINPSYVYAYVGSNKFATVPDSLQELVRSGIYDDAVVEESSFEDRVVSVPHMLSNAAWFYNKDHFAEAGLTGTPASMTEVLEYARKLVKYEGDVMTRSGVSLRLTGGASGTTEKWWVLLMQYGGELITEVSPGKYVAGYNNQAGFDTMSYYLDALYEYKVDNFDIAHDVSAFLAGETAMFARESSVIVEAANNAPDLNYGTFPMFNTNIAITKSWYVLDNGDAAKIDAGWKYIEYVNQPDNMIKYHHLTGYQPARKDLDTEQLVAGVEQRGAFFKDFDKVYTYLAIDEFQEVMVRLATRLMDAYTKEDMCGNDEAIWTFLEEAAAETNSLLEEYGHYGG